MSERTSNRRAGMSLRYAPRNGTMRGSGDAPAATARTSAQAPDVLGLQSASGVGYRCASVSALQCRDVDAGGHRGATRPQLTGQGVDDAAEVNDAGLRREEPVRRRDVRLALPSLVGIDPLEAWHAGAAATRLELVQTGDLRAVDGEDELSDLLIPDTVSIAERVQLVASQGPE